MRIKFHHNLNWKNVLAALASVRLTIILIVILIVFIILSSFIPQGADPQDYLRQFGWPTYRWLEILQLTAIYRSLWFILPMLLLGVNVIACTAKSTLEKDRHWGYFITHISLILLIAGGLLTGAGRVQGQVRIAEGQTINSYEARGFEIPLGFQIRLQEFSIKAYDTGNEYLIFDNKKTEPLKVFFERGKWTSIPGTPYEFRAEKFIPDFRIDLQTNKAYSASDDPRNPAVWIHIKGGGLDYYEWALHLLPPTRMLSATRPFAIRYIWKPLQPKDYISDLEILEQGKVVLSKRLRVNHPLRYKEYMIYQVDYDQDNYAWSGLQIVKDPGVGVVFIGAVGFILGTIYSLYIWPFRSSKKSKQHLIDPYDGIKEKV